MGADQKSVSEANTIGEYFILDLVGSGGLGQVYKAKHRRTKEIVALKRLHDQYQTNKKLLGLFHKEIMIHSQVSHPNCVRFVEACLTPPDAHIVTSFVDGYNCHSLILEHNKISSIPPNTFAQGNKYNRYILINYVWFSSLKTYDIYR